MECGTTLDRGQEPDKSTAGKPFREPQVLAGAERLAG